jgi:hypothetical protein
LLQKVDPQHPFQPDGRPAAFTLRVERLQTRHQPGPWHNPFHLGQKLVAPRLLLLGPVFHLRKTALPLHRSAAWLPDRQILPDPRNQNAPYFSVSLTSESFLLAPEIQT